MTFQLKRYDTSPSIRYALEPAGEIDLTGATVVFNMREPPVAAAGQVGVLAPGDVKIDRQPATIIQASGSPTVQYDWQMTGDGSGGTGDTDQLGTFEAEFEVTYSNGTVETFPNSGYISVVIAEDIA